MSDEFERWVQSTPLTVQKPKGYTRESLQWAYEDGQEQLRQSLAATDALLAEAVEVIRYYADHNNYWDYEDGGKVHVVTNADQGQKANQFLEKVRGK